MQRADLVHVLAALQPFEAIIARHGGVFTHEDFMTLIWDKLSGPEGLPARQELNYRFDTSKLCLAPVRTRRWGKCRSRIRMAGNPAEGYVETSLVKWRAVPSINKSYCAVAPAPAPAAPEQCVDVMSQSSMSRSDSAQSDGMVAVEGGSGVGRC